MKENFLLRVKYAALAMIAVAGTTGAAITPPDRDRGQAKEPIRINCTEEGNKVNVHISGNLSNVPMSGDYAMPLYNGTEEAAACKDAVAKLRPVAGDTFALLAGRFIPGEPGRKGFLRLAIVEYQGKPAGEMTYIVYGFDGRRPYPDEATGSFQK